MAKQEKKTSYIIGVDPQPPKNSFDLEYYTKYPVIGIKYFGPFKSKWCFIDSLGNVPKYPVFNNKSNSALDVLPKKHKVHLHKSGKSYSQYPNKNIPAIQGTSLTDTQIQGLKHLRGYSVDEAECIYKKMQAMQILVDYLRKSQYNEQKLESYLNKMLKSKIASGFAYSIAEGELPYVFSYIVTNAFLKDDFGKAHYKKYEELYKAFFEELQQNIYYEQNSETYYDLRYYHQDHAKSAFEKPFKKPDMYEFNPYKTIKLIPGLGENPSKKYSETENQPQ